MRRDDTPEWLQTVALVVALVAFCWFGVKYTAPAPPVAPPPPPEIAICGSVVERCRASADAKLEAYDGNLCDDEKAKRAIEPLLREPLGLGECADIIQRLGAKCPDDCMLEGKNYLVVPSKVVFQSAKHADESGRCWARGEMFVTVRGRCIPKEPAANG